MVDVNVDGGCANYVSLSGVLAAAAQRTPGSEAGAEVVHADMLLPQRPVPIVVTLVAIGRRARRLLEIAPERRLSVFGRLVPLSGGGLGVGVDWIEEGGR